MTAGPEVEHWNTERDGPLSETAMREKLEALGYRVSRYIYPPGTRFEEHTHEVDKIDCVLSGRFRIKMKEREVVLKAGDRIAVARGEKHSAEVVGDAEVVSLDAIRI